MRINPIRSCVDAATLFNFWTRFPEIPRKRFSAASGRIWAGSRTDQESEEREAAKCQISSK
jgi:hypothetical protein